MEERQILDAIDNLSEEEMGQLHAIHLSMNAVAAARKAIRSGPSLAECEECGEPIPEDRQRAIAGCTTCIICQQIIERKQGK